MMMNNPILPLGKLPPDLLVRILNAAPVSDQRVLLAGGIGLDCAVVDAGDKLLVLKSEPITFVTAEIGWYAVQVSCNDIATTGADPRWLLTSLMLPEDATTPALVEEIAQQVFSACQEYGISVIGGHTEVTHGLDRPILVSMLVGEVDREKLVTPRGARPGDRVLLTKGVPVEGVAILAREFPEKVIAELGDEAQRTAAEYLYRPGISVLSDARIATACGRVTAMHDPTEGGLAAALWELAEASQTDLRVDLSLVPVSDLAKRVCNLFGLDPFATIASGALLMTVDPADEGAIMASLHAAGIECAAIGTVESGTGRVWNKGIALHRPMRDDITKVF